MDEDGNAYLARHAAGNDFPTTPGALQPDFGGGARDVVVTKLNADGNNLLYSTYLGGSGTDDGRGVVIDNMGNAYVSGRTTSMDFPLVNPLQATHGGSYDAFVAKVDASGSALLLSTYLGGSGDENMVGNEPHGETGGLALDSMGNIYLIGATESVDFPTASPLQPTFGGGDYDSYVAKLNANEATWLLTDSLKEGRHSQTATPLSDGRVLIVGGTQGGFGGEGLTSVEVYEPISDTWSTAASLNVARNQHTATPLPDGKVLVVGGWNGSSTPVYASVEVYDPSSDSWSYSDSLAEGRRLHTATPLLDGKVLVVGGRTTELPGAVRASAEIYDPAGGTWSTTGSLNTPRENHSATLLEDGRVLVVGGYYMSHLESAEVFDPVSGTWSVIPSPIACHGVSHTATRLLDGRVLVAGGACSSGIQDDAEIYDPISGTWTATSALPEVREAHRATLLPDGNVLITGGDDGDAPRYDSALIYYPASGAWNLTASLNFGRRNHTATLMLDDRVLAVAGANDDLGFLDSTEVFYYTSVPSPVAAFTASPLSGTAPLTVTFTDQSTGTVTSWMWHFGDGDTSTDQNPTHVYTVKGTYSVTQEVYGPGGSDEEIKGAYVVVDYAPPVVDFVASTLTGTVPLTVTFTDLSIGAITTWDWTFGDGGTSGARHSRHEFVDSGTYTVTLTASGPAGSDTEAKAEYISASPAISPTWTFLLYLDGDNNLRYWFEQALDRLEAASSNPHVAILVQFDGPNEEDTWRYKIQPGENLSWYMWEQAMDDPQTLSDFVIWARENFPSDHTYLAVADHGRGTSGIAWDDTSGSDHFITVTELRTALQNATAGGAEPLDVVHYDACLMAMVEHAYQIKDYAHYLVASENLGWSVFAYDQYATQVTTSTVPVELATAIVDEYHSELTSLTGYPHTISALDLGQAEAVEDVVTEMASALRASLAAHKYYVLNSRDGTQKFDSRDYYVINVDDEYLDLFDFARLIKQNVPDVAVQDAAQEVMDAVGALVVAEQHESGHYQNYPYWDLEDAHGAAIYFPPAPGGWDYDDYMSHVFWFTADSQWDEFLQEYFGLMGQPPEPPIDPGTPPVLEKDRTVYLPLVMGID